jgi:hypothetical protein
MKVVCGFLAVVLVLSIANRGLAQGQQPTPKISPVSTNATPLQASKVLPNEPTAMRLRLAQPAATNSFEYQVSKTTKVRVYGPIVQPLKAKTGAEFSHRVLHWISPFAKEQPTWQTAPAGPVNTRAWSTIVGWSPGRSAFPDDTWHDPPHLNLLSVSVEKQP